MTAVSLIQLDESVRAPGQDQGDGEAHEAEEQPHAAFDLVVAGLLPAPLGAEIPDKEVAEEAAEEEDGEDLEAQPGEGEVYAHLALARRGGGEAAACALEDEGDEVAGDEDVVEEFGVEARQLGGEGGDASLKQQMSIRT
jgi:hypothetical protein